MDLHDVARGRGSLDRAMLRVTAPTMAVGIWSDMLYPAYQQQQIHQTLVANGVPSEYVEIDSPHGHDAFLINSDQLDEPHRTLHRRCRQVRHLSGTGVAAVPEGLEAEIWRSAIEVTVGANIEQAWVDERVATPGFADAVTGATIAGVRRAGKIVLVDTDGPTIGLHFGMTGRVVVDGVAPIARLQYASGRDDPAVGSAAGVHRR